MYGLIKKYGWIKKPGITMIIYLSNCHETQIAKFIGLCKKGICSAYRAGVSTISEMSLLNVITNVIYST